LLESIPERILFAVRSFTMTSGIGSDRPVATAHSRGRWMCFPRGA
jgi:hypothetical protein